MKTSDGHEPETCSNEHVTYRQWSTTDWVHIRAAASAKIPRAAEYVLVALPKRLGNFSDRRSLDLRLGGRACGVLRL